jgi:hypothetical protein
VRTLTVGDAERRRTEREAEQQGDDAGQARRQGGAEDRPFSLLLGAVPGTFIGARLSSRAPQMVIWRSITIVLLASGRKLLGVPTPATAVVLFGSIVLGPVLMAIRGWSGLPMLWRTERRQAADKALV